MFIFPFIVLGRLIARMNPLPKEYRVFYFFPFYHIGGAEKVHAQVAQGTGGADCIIFFTRKSHNEFFLEEFRKSGCTIRDISTYTDNKFLYFLNLVWRGIISGYINAQQKKPIVFNGQCNFAYKLAPWVNSSIKQVELIHSLNSFSYIRIPFLPFISKTVMISRKRIEDHLELYTRKSIPPKYNERIAYIPNAISLPLNEIDKPQAPFKVLYVGRGTAEKRVHIIARLAKQLQAKDAAIEFEFLGDVSEAISPSAYPFIKFWGNQGDAKLISSIYQSAHVLIITSDTEGFPMVIIEAMAHGCAILATAVGDIPYHIRPAENGYLFSSVKDEDQIVGEAEELILQLKNHPEEWKKISLNNIQYAKHNFGIEKFNEAYHNILN